MPPKGYIALSSVLCGTGYLCMVNWDTSNGVPVNFTTGLVLFLCGVLLWGLGVYVLLAQNYKYRFQLAQQRRPVWFRDPKAVDCTDISEDRKKAQQLLQVILPDSLWQQYLQTGYITVTSPKNHCEYRLYGTSTVPVFKRGRYLGYYCLAPERVWTYPKEDIIATHYLHLITDEKWWRRRGNWLPTASWMFWLPILT